MYIHVYRRMHRLVYGHVRVKRARTCATDMCHRHVPRTCATDMCHRHVPQTRLPRSSSSARLAGTCMSSSRSILRTSSSIGPSADLFWATFRRIYFGQPFGGSILGNLSAHAGGEPQRPGRNGVGLTSGKGSGARRVFRFGWL